MSETKSKIVNESKSQYAPALGYRVAAIAYTKRNYMTKQEAAARGIDLTEVSKAVQYKSSVAASQAIVAQMEDKSDVGEYIAKMFKGPTGYEAFEVDVVETGHDKVDLEYHYCPLVKAWQEMGLSDEEIAQLCDSAMVGDTIMAETAGFELDIQKTIARGDGVCKLVYHAKK